MVLMEVNLAENYGEAVRALCAGAAAGRRAMLRPTRRPEKMQSA
jgi:hypothetical protein